MCIVRSRQYQADLEHVIHSGILQMFAHKTILITGASGMIGSCLVDLIMCCNRLYPEFKIRVVAVSRAAQVAYGRFKEYWGDDNFSFLEHSVADCFPKDCVFDYVIHAASLASPDIMMREPVDTMLANFLGMYNVLEAARRCDATRVLFVSSGEVYGNVDKDTKAEADYGYVDQLKIRAAYPISKRAAETLCVAYRAQYGVDSVIVRPGHTFGPTMTRNDMRASSAFIRDVVEGKNIIMNSAGQIVRSYIYVLDTVRAIIIVLEKGKSGEAYNVAGEEAISIRKFAEITAEIGGQEIEFQTENIADFKITRQVLDTSLLRALGWKAETDIRTGIQKTVNELLEVACK